MLNWETSMEQRRALASCQRHEPLAGCVVLAVAGEVDAQSATAFEEELLAAFEAAKERLVVNLEEVTFFDSAGIRCLIGLRQRAGDRSSAVRLVMPRRLGVRRALDISAVHTLFGVAGSVSEALAPSGPA
jgi:anti-sigma B factor antagonist